MAKQQLKWNSITPTRWESDDWRFDITELPDDDRFDYVAHDRITHEERSMFRNLNEAQAWCNNVLEQELAA